MNKEIEELKNYLKALPKLADEGREERIKKATDDYRSFMYTYLPHQIEFQFEETSDFRNFVYDELPDIIETNRLIELEAYRGGAKTTVISRGMTLWVMLTKRKRYGVLLSSTNDVVVESMETIKAELEDNATLRSDFDVVIGTPWTDNEIVFYVKGNPVKIKAAGAGKKIRGSNFMGQRPDWINLDDIENDENVESKTQRDKLYRWFIKAIMKLPSRKSRTHTFMVVGTRLHHDSLLARIAKRSDCYHRNFPLVIEMPSRLDELTKENLSLEIVGDAVLDDPDIDVLSIFSDFLEDKESFYSELQNQPISSEGLTFGNYSTYSDAPEMNAYYIGVDPALGKTKGDYFGLAVLGYSKPLKRYYASVQGHKTKPENMIPLIVSKFISLRSTGVPVKIAIETVQFQEFFKDKLKSEALSIGVPLPVVEIKNRASKELRIDSLSPHISDGTILIDQNSHLLVEELTTYPKAPHDDLLDALEMAWRIAFRGAGLDMKAVERVQKTFKLTPKGRILE
ncbi:MAG: phage terminase large subunit [Sulfuricurvum sp.]|uniref:phage terminase large subunit n=1 Tax=Sulfuricurvum sp. TaxID=2025608 RepID=UPI0035686D19